MSYRFQVQIKIGSVTKVNDSIEFDSLSSCLAFYETVCASKVMRVLGSSDSYYNPSNIIPIDDFNYRSLVRGFYGHKELRQTLPFILHYVKSTITTKELDSAFQQYASIDNLRCNQTYFSSFPLPLNHTF